MRYRFYIELDKQRFLDTGNVLLSAREFLDVEGDVDEKTYKKAFDIFCPDCSATEPVGHVRVRSFLKRARRADREQRELSGIISLLKPKSEFSIRQGTELVFSEFASEDEIAYFVSENLSPAVYSLEKEGVGGEENLLIEGFCNAEVGELFSIKEKLNIKMEIDDLMCVQNYFISESREPSLLEIRIIDSFFSENFRHTTFETILDSVESEDALVSDAWKHYRELRNNATPSLSDIIRGASEIIRSENVIEATKKLRGLKIKTADSNDELLLLVKAESHNRSTTVDPYNGAASNLCGAVKDIMCAFGYAYDSYRVSGTGNSDLCAQKAALATAGYAEASSRLGVPCGKSQETVSPLFEKKQLEVCSVLAVADGTGTKKMLQKEPMPGDKIYVIGSKTGADGINSSSVRCGHAGESIPVSHSGELVALQRLFVKSAFADIAVAVNDIGSGGIVCALGEMVSGANINVSEISTKYSGISVQDTILSESNERMIVCVRSENCDRLESLCKADGVECSKIATVNDEKRFIIVDRDGNKYASLTSEFILWGGAEKHLSAFVEKPSELSGSKALEIAKEIPESVGALKKIFTHGAKYSFEGAYREAAKEIKESRSELSHAFDRVAGGNFVEGYENVNGSAVSVHKLSYVGKAVTSENGKNLCSVLSCGAFPEASSISPYRGAYLSVVDSVIKLIAAGCGDKEIHLALQEYLPEHKNSSKRLGNSVASMLGVFEAQMELGVSSLGSRISIGTAENEKGNNSAVTSFAFCTCEEGEPIGCALKDSGSKIILIKSEPGKGGLPSGSGVNELKNKVSAMLRAGIVRSMASVNLRCVCSVLMEMCRANRCGVKMVQDISPELLFEAVTGALICEISADAELPKGAELIGYVTDDFRFTREKELFELAQVFSIKERRIPRGKADTQFPWFEGVCDRYGRVKPTDGGRPKILMPMTDYSVAQNDIRAEFTKRGADVRVLRVNENNVSELVKNIKKTDVIWLSDDLGSGAFLKALLSEKRVKAEIEALIERKGLVFGFGSAFSAIVESGLMGVDKKRLRFVNRQESIASEAVKLRAVSSMSPFMRKCEAERLYDTYTSVCGLKLLCNKNYLEDLAGQGRIGAQYLDNGNAAGSEGYVDSVCSEDGLVFGQLSRPLNCQGAIPIIESVSGYFSSYNNL